VNLGSGGEYPIYRNINQKRLSQIGPQPFCPDVALHLLKHGKHFPNLASKAIFSFFLSLVGKRILFLLSGVAVAKEKGGAIPAKEKTILHPISVPDSGLTKSPFSK
ncbi:hypothetical protein HAX54_032438, partial [Datura stramonium]|nr:hypothetical protein [Datura stramonium]